MSTINAFSNSRKKAKYFNVFATFFYSLIFFIFVFFFNFLYLMSDSSKVTTIKLYIMLFVWAFPMMSIPISITLLWANYFYKNYEKKAFYFFIPFFTTFSTYIIGSILHGLLNS